MNKVIAIFCGDVGEVVMTASVVRTSAISCPPWRAALLARPNTMLAKRSWVPITRRIRSVPHWMKRPADPTTCGNNCARNSRIWATVRSNHSMIVLSVFNCKLDRVLGKAGLVELAVDWAETILVPATVSGGEFPTRVDLASSLPHGASWSFWQHLRSKITLLGILCGCVSTCIEHLEVIASCHPTRVKHRRFSRCSPRVKLPDVFNRSWFRFEISCAVFWVKRAFNLRRRNFSRFWALVEVWKPCSVASALVAPNIASLREPETSLSTSTRF
mmetsp:Transcript_95182/g.132261  ORF Transcript_95182/g.132261 Transcript_95182/m.132261 type:complete len:273 (-) Transcript_95182:131-949(-)